jgi:hypothetical protein
MKRTKTDEASKLRAHALRVWEQLATRHEQAKKDLRSVEREITEMYPAVQALLSKGDEAA